MKDLHCFMIYTEHHVIQLERAIDYYKIPLSKVVIVIYIYKHLHNNLDWIERLEIKYSTCHSILKYESWCTVNTHYLTHRLEIIKFKLDLYRLKKKVTCLYSSLYVDPAFVAYIILGKPHFTLLDEGTASFGVVIKRRNKVSTMFLIKESIAYLLLFRYPKSITYFSQYNLQIGNNDKINSYKFERKNNNLLLIDNYVLLLGSSVSEVNAMSESNYLFLVNSVKMRYPNSYLIYYPHRFESKNKLEQIQNLGFTLQENKIPFELFFSSLNKCPEVVISFCSPILGNILQMYDNTPYCIMIKPRRSLFLKNETIYMDIYDHYKTFNQIEIWELF